MQARYLSLGVILYFSVATAQDGANSAQITQRGAGNVASVRQFASPQGKKRAALANPIVAGEKENVVDIRQAGTRNRYDVKQNGERAFLSTGASPSSAAIRQAGQ
ncbi:MAG: hypothetical protein ABW189_05275 [Rickettsiales bacterium]